MAYDPYKASFSYADPYQLQRDASLLESLGGNVVSGLDYVGGLLDKLTGARALRGLLGGQWDEVLSILPGSDTFGLTNEENAISGRDLLESAGVLGTNQPGLDFGDVGGFLAEVALDPSAWASFGATTAAKNLLPDAAAASLRTLGNLPSTPTRWAATKGLDDLGMHSDLLGAIPGGDLLNKGAYGYTQSLLDDTSIGRNLRSAFQPEVMGRETKFGQGVARGVYDNAQQTRAKVREGTTDVMSLLRESDELGKQAELRAAVEGAEPASPAIGEAAQLMRDEFDEIQNRLVENGALKAGLQDASGAKFAPRGYTDPSGSDNWGGGIRDPLGKKRKEFLKHIRDDKLGATGQVQQILQDTNLDSFGSAKEARKYIEKTYGSKFYSPKVSEDLAKALIEEEKLGLKGVDALKSIVKKENKAHKKLLKTDPDAAKSPLHLQAEGTLKNTRRRMTRLADYARSLSPEEKVRGISNRDMLTDSERYRSYAKSALNAQDALYDAIPEMAKMVGADTKTTTVDKLLRKSGLAENSNGFARAAQSLGIDTTAEDWLKEVKRTRIPVAEAKDIAGLVKTNMDSKKIGTIGKAWDSFTSLFKVGVLTWPARFVRDQTTGFYLNSLNGARPADAAAAATLMAKDSIGSKILNLGDKSGLVKDAGSFKAVQEVLSRRGLQNTPENATQALRDLAYSHEVISRRTMETAGQVTPKNSLQGILDQMLGTRQSGHLSSLNRLKDYKNPAGWNPFSVRGVVDKAGEVRKESGFIPAQIGEDLGFAVEGMNRLPLFIAELRKGADAGTAAKRVNEVHFDYRPEAKTGFENKLKRIVPFYTWNRAAIPFVLRELWDKPGGGMAQTIRAQRNLTGDTEDSGYVPNYLRAQTSIPLGGMDPSGTQKFLTGFGLPQEAVLENFAVRPTTGGTIESLLQKAFSQAHPLLKAPVELALGKQFYGGRELSDLDSPAERVMRNLTGDSPDIPIWLDQAISNSPLTRAVNTARVLTDERKTAGQKALNLLTGVRVTDANLPKLLEAEIRESSKELLSEGRVFENLFVPRRTLETLETTDPENWGPGGTKRNLLELYQGTQR